MSAMATMSTVDTMTSIFETCGSVIGWITPKVTWLGHHVSAGVNWALATKVGVIATDMFGKGWALAVANPTFSVGLLTAAVGIYVAYRILRALFVAKT